MPGVEFELWHGRDVPNTKIKNYQGDVAFKHKQLPCFRLPIKTNNGSSTQQFIPFLLFRLIHFNPDVILAEGASSIFSLSTAFIYTKLFHKRLIMWSMGRLAGREYSGIRKMIQSWIRTIEINSDALFVYSSQAEKYFIHEGVDPRRIFKAVNVIDTKAKISSLRESEPIRKELGFNVVFVGAINKTKRIEILIDAVELLSQRHRDVKLHLIGDGNYMPNIRDYITNKELDSIVVLHGRVTEGLNVLLSHYQVLALPGLGGLAIVDGMISSLPIISGLADGTELDLIDTSNGFVTDNMTVDYMVEKLEYLYNNPNIAKKMGERSYEKITGEFSYDNYIKQFSHCLDFVLDK